MSLSIEELGYGISLIVNEFGIYNKPSGSLVEKITLLIGIEVSLLIVAVKSIVSPINTKRFIRF